jgi:hypothetical protein
MISNIGRTTSLYLNFFTRQVELEKVLAIEGHKKTMGERILKILRLTLAAINSGNNTKNAYFYVLHTLLEVRQALPLQADHYH